MDPDDEEVYPYLLAWANEARAVLLAAASRYRAIVQYEDLKRRIEIGSGVDRYGRWHWMRKTLELVAEDCAKRCEPLLLALCLKGDRVTDSYALALGRTRVELDDIEDAAAEERLVCYERFGTANPPPDANRSARVDECFDVSRPELSDSDVPRVGHWVELQRRTQAERAARKAERDAIKAEQELRLIAHEIARRHVTALPGSVIDVYFDGDPSDAETYVLDSPSLRGPLGERSRLSPHGLLGAVLIGMKEGETRSYAQRNGQTASVTLVRTQPHKAFTPTGP